MVDIKNIFLFVFIFTLLVCIRNIVILFISIFKTPPKQVKYTNKEIIYIGLSISYIITYLLN